MLRTALKPGDSVPETQVFWVHHYQHRLSHLARILFEALPECERCGDRVRYEIVTVNDPGKVELLRSDRDFQHAVGRIPSRALG